MKHTIYIENPDMRADGRHGPAVMLGVVMLYMLLIMVMGLLAVAVL